jgi:hypothetical protein
VFDQGQAYVVESIGAIDGQRRMPAEESIK